MFSLSSFFSDLRSYGLRVAVWNLKFSIGHDILPGTHKHITVLASNENCSKCDG